MDLRRDYSEEELTRFAFKLTLEFPPGSRWNYSNTGYVLLGVIIHKASGQFYGDLLRERVFAPLGMTTARVISEADIVPHRAAGYRLDNGDLKNQHWVSPTFNTTADGALYLSVHDLLAWDKGLRSGAVLGSKSWAQVYDPVTLNSGNTYPYGFGWFVDTVNGDRLLHHSGAWQGFKSQISRYLGEDLTIIVLANLAEADPGRFVDGIAGMLVPALAPKELTAIPDREPEVRARLDTLLRLAKDGQLSAGGPCICPRRILSRDREGVPGAAVGARRGSAGLAARSQGARRRSRLHLRAQLRDRVTDCDDRACTGRKTLALQHPAETAAGR